MFLAAFLSSHWFVCSLLTTSIHKMINEDVELGSIISSLNLCLKSRKTHNCSWNTPKPRTALLRSRKRLSHTRLSSLTKWSHARFQPRLRQTGPLQKGANMFLAQPEALSMGILHSLDLVQLQESTRHQKSRQKDNKKRGERTAAD